MMGFNHLLKQAGAEVEPSSSLVEIKVGVAVKMQIEFSYFFGWLVGWVGLCGLGWGGW